ncbi:hypothetical protein JOL62DRAFT_316136 [Phyllosticta paracitricarpa]|uniref:Uncharacterized protein n=1 Tax=Phyllosticta paracitricarpa TaxID=2016321 RepID=A0ABR1MWU0_9PEZI
MLTHPAASLLGNLFRSTVLGATSIFEADDPTTARLRPSLVSTRSKCPIARQCLRPAQLPATYEKSQLQRRLARNQCYDGKYIPTATQVSLDGVCCRPSRLPRCKLAIDCLRTSVARPKTLFRGGRRKVVQPAVNLSSKGEPGRSLQCPLLLMLIQQSRCRPMPARCPLRL